MAWCFILAVLLHVRRMHLSPSPTAIQAQELKTILMSFRTYLKDLENDYEYPRRGPSQKYAIASSRQAYLYSALEWYPDMIEVLRCVQRMVRRR